MSRISRSTANQIARNMTETLVAKYDALYDSFVAKIVAIHNRSLPAPVKKLIASKFKKYISTTSYLNAIGIKDGARNYVRVYAPDNTPVYHSSDGTPDVKLIGPEGRELKALYRNYLKSKDQYVKLKNETVNALVRLGTTTEIKKTWPDAAQYLPVRIKVPVPKSGFVDVKLVAKKVKDATNGKR